MADTTDDIYSENNYVDSKGNKLERGFYKSCGANNIIYFNLEYNSEGLPIFERENENTFEIEALNSQLVKRLYNISIEEVKNKLENMKAKASWIEKRLKE
jgi:hypothetical protein